MDNIQMVENQKNQFSVYKNEFKRFKLWKLILNTYFGVRSGDWIWLAKTKSSIQWCRDAKQSPLEIADPSKNS
jgi:hypothetical protein